MVSANTQGIISYMIVVTGAAGFIGSCLVQRLNEEGERELVLVDDFSDPAQNLNFAGKGYAALVDRDAFPGWLRSNHSAVRFIFHIGARTDTAEFDRALLNALNLEYSKTLWKLCAEFGLPLIYASSAATYGLGEHGYDDDESLIPSLKPLNPYGESKNDFDAWALQQKDRPEFWAGLKFFNVYGPNEYHKGRMASVIFHAYGQISRSGGLKLFQSHKPEYGDGEQRRDFIYVKDVVDVLIFLMRHRRDSGIYNLGSGRARTFLDLANATFRAMDREVRIDFIPTPEDIRDTYQYFTEATMTKLRSIGYGRPFHTLEEGIEDYVKGYLVDGRYL